jgi:CysZ protein
MSTLKTNNPFTGAGYLLKGMQLVLRPRLRRFVIVPALVNLVIFVGAIYYSAGWVYEQSRSVLPQWLDWLALVLVPLVVIVFMAAMFFTFTMLANLIASPFNGLLAEAVELRLTGREAPASSLAQIFKDVGASIASELKKLGYILVRIVPLMLLLLVPVVGQVLWAVFSAWMLAISFADYPMANHGLSFPDQRRLLARRRWMSLGFGLAVLFAMTIPVLNFFVMPCAVAGATAMWVEQFAEDAGSAARPLEEAAPRPARTGHGAG